MENKVKLIKFIGLRYADPVSSIDLTDDYLLFVFFLGATNLYIIKQNKLKTLSEIQDEYISGVKIYNNKLYICIGDFKILAYELNNDIHNENILEYIEIKNYKDDDNDTEHNNNCENCLTMLNDNYLIRTFIDFPAEPNSQGVIKDTKFSIKNIINKSENNDDDDNEEIKGEIKMSNYCVPFDFDGINYIYIDFIKENERTFNIYNVNSKSEKKIEIEKKFENENFGHISHLKVIKKDLLFLVRNYNICELRNYDLELKNALNIKSKEILAFDLLFDNDGNQESKDNINNNKITNENEITRENEGEKDKDLLFIGILDIDCNVFLYNYKKDSCKLLFNLEKDDIGIDEDIKGQRFFLFGYPYYMKITKKYIAISSDYGCILVQYSSSDN